MPKPKSLKIKCSKNHLLKKCPLSIQILFAFVTLIHNRTGALKTVACNSANGFAGAAATATFEKGRHAVGSTPQTLAGFTEFQPIQ
ncbi:MAG TPA: hypothetical protein VLL95_01760 [Phnomibacter sp.]|nr:hypothetical protein [Phnomibacter sp.]